MQSSGVENTSPVKRLSSPRRLSAQASPDQNGCETVLAAREAVRNCINGRDSRFLAIVGPCSIHDSAAALEYGRRIARLRRELSGRIEILMRVYVEKPRTITGWKGLVYDPHLDGSNDIEQGLRIARSLLARLTSMGVPVATEFVDPMICYYLSDLISWACIGARTSESQTHRQVASGLAMPVGFKNGTDGGVNCAIHAALAAQAPHTAIGVDRCGRMSAISTQGNNYGHIVLRGGARGPNYGPAHVMQTAAQSRELGLDPAIIIDSSHMNSRGNPDRQAAVFISAVEQGKAQGSPVRGAMLESNIYPGTQKSAPGAKLAYGVSITDSCIGWDETERLLRSAARF